MHKPHHVKESALGGGFFVPAYGCNGMSGTQVRPPPYPSQQLFVDFYNQPCVVTRMLFRAYPPRPNRRCKLTWLGHGLVACRDCNSATTLWKDSPRLRRSTSR